MFSWYVCVSVCVWEITFEAADTEMFGTVVHLDHMYQGHWVNVKVMC